MKSKFMSGRYYLTIVGGIAFLYCIYKGSLNPEAISSILTGIFLSYFNRSDRGCANEDNKPS